MKFISNRITISTILFFLCVSFILTGNPQRIISFYLNLHYQLSNIKLMCI